MRSSKPPCRSADRDRQAGKVDHGFEVGYVVAAAAAAGEFSVAGFDCVELVRMELPIEITGPTGMGEPGPLVALRTPDGHHQVHGMPLWLRDSGRS
jgi:hypothetical protein